MWAIIAAVIAVAASAGVYYQQRKMEAQAKKQAQEAKAVQISGHDSNRGLYTVYGKALIGSTTVWKKVSDKQTKMTQTGFTTFSRGTGDLINGTRDLKSNRFLYRAVSLCAGPIQSVENILIDDEGYQSSRFGQGDNRHFAAAVSLGPTAGQNFSAMRTSYADFNAWGTSFTGKGVAYAIERLYLDNDKPAYQGEPSTKYLVKGRKLYDPRKDSTSSVYDATLGTSSHRFATPSTWEWSDNPVLALLDYMTNSEYGRGLALSVIDLESIADSADKCDVLVDIPGRLTNDTGTSYQFYDAESGEVITVQVNDNLPNHRREQGTGAQQKRFRLNIAIDPSKELLDNIQEILNVFRGNLSYANGKYRVHMADVASPVLTIGDDDIITGLKISNGDRSQRMNRATIKFINANKQHKTDQVSWPSLDSNEDDGLYDTYLTEDQGEKLHKTFTIKGCTDYYQAQDTAEFLVRDSRSNLTVAGTFGSRCFGLVPGDIVSLTYDSAGYSGKYFRVMQVAIDLTSMNVNLQLKEYDSSVYTWNDARGTEPEGLSWQEEVVNAAPTTPTIGTLSSTTRTRADGSTALTLTIPFSNIPEQAQYVDVEWGINGTDQYNSQVVFDTENISQVEVPIEQDNTTYAVRVRYFITDSAGTLMSSNFATDTITVGTLTGTKLEGIEAGATANTGALADLDTVDTDQIEDNAVTIAKVADTLQSTDYSAGSAGWKLTTGGVFEAGDGTFRGDITAKSFTIEAGATVSGIEAQAVAGLPQASFTSIGASTYSPAVNGSRVTWTETTTNESWTTKLLSDQSFGGGSFVTFVINTDNATNARYMVGLGTATGVGFSNIDYAVYVRGTNGDILAYESGTSAATLKASISAGDIITVLYDGNKVQYIINGTVEREVNLTSPLTGQVYAHIAIDDGSTHVEHRIDGLQFGPVTSVVENLNDGVSLTSGGLTLSSGGAIKGGQTAYDNGTGFFLGYENSAYKLSIGDSTGDKLTFDGTDLTVTGDITATSLTLSGTSIAEGQLAQGVQDSLGLADSALQNGDDITDGSVGGVTITSTKLYQGTGTFNNSNTGFYLDNAGQFSLKDKLSFDGTDLTVSGDVTAANFTLSSGATLDDTDGQIANVAININFPVEGLTYYWPCNSIANDELVDVVGGKTGTHDGATPSLSTDSPSGNSLVNALGSGWTLLNDTDADNLEGANGFAWSIWFRSETTAGDSDARIIGRDASDGWALVIDQAGTSQGLVLYGEPGTESMGTIAANEWHHFVLSEDGNGTISGYLDGELIGTESYTPVVSSRPVVIGCNTESSINTSASRFVGKLTEVRAYNRALTALEVRALYKVPAGGLPQKLDGDMIVTGSITASQLAADAVTAGKINVTNLAAINSDLGAITAGSLNINNAFIVTSAGVMTATGATISGGSVSGTTTIDGTNASTVKDGAAAGATALQIGDIAEIISAGNIPTGQLTFNDSGSKSVSYDGNNISVTGGNDNSWDSQVYSSEHYASPCVLQFETTFNSTYRFMMGLNEDPTTNTSYTSIDYSWYLNTSSATIYESGAQTAPDGGSFSYSVGDKFSIVYDGDNIYYYHNDTLKRTVTGVGAKDFYLDSSLYDSPLTINDVRFAPISRIDYGSIGGVTITPGKLYQGTGTHNNTNTGFYLDSSGKFSLKDKLSFDGTTLSVDGNVTVDEFVKAGSGSTAAVMSGRSADNFAFWAGADFDASGGASGGNAPFRVTRAGKVIMTNFALYSTTGQKLFDSTDGLLGLPSTQVAASTGSLVSSVSDELTSGTDYATIQLSSTQTITVDFDYPLNYLFADGTSEANAYGRIASSITVTIQKSTDASTWSTFGSVTFNKTDSSSASTAQYYVQKQTVYLGSEFGGGTLYFASLQPGGAVDDGNVLNGNVSASLATGTHYLRMQVTYSGTSLAPGGTPTTTSARSITLTTSGAGFTVDSSGNVSDGVSTSATTGWVLSNFVEKTESDNVTINGTLTLGGDLVVNGTTTTINSATLQVDDKNIVLNYGAGDTSASANGAGITIQDAVNSSTDATILWDATNDEFDFSHTVSVSGNLTATGNIRATGSTAYLEGKSLILDNGEVSDTDFANAYQMIVDANDSDSDVPNHGDSTGGYPFGVYFLGDNGGTTKTLGAGLVKLWHTGHFKKAHIDHFVGLYGGTQNLTVPNLTATGQVNFEGWVYVDTAGQNLVLRSDTSERETLEWQQGTTRTWTLNQLANGNLNFDPEASYDLQIAGNRILTTADLSSIDRTILDNTDDIASGTANSPGNGFYAWGSSAPTNSPDDYAWMLDINDASQPQQWVGAYGGAANRVDLYARRRTGGTWDTTWTKFWNSVDFSSTDVSNWNTAYGWGNHASEGYLKSLSFDALTNKTSGSGDYKTTGKFRSSDNIVSGEGSGGVALTVNDSKGNANVTFNHEDGVPEQTGNAARIEVNTDSSTGAAMYFELKSGVTGGTSVDLTNIFHIDENGLDMDSGKGIKINGTEVITSARALTNIGTISSGEITTTAPQFKYVSNTDANVGLLIRDETYASNEADITATRLNSGANLTLGLAGQAGINAYVNGSNVFSLNSSGNATFGGTISSGAITTTSNVQLPQGYNLQWGGAYSAGNPSISAGSNFIAFYPTGNTDGEVIKFDASGIDVNGHSIIDVNSIQIAGASTLQESADRGGLIELTDSGGTWTGIQISKTEGDHWSVMGSTTSFGLYDDQNGSWILQHSQGGGTLIYHNGNAKLETTSSGVTVTGIVQASSDLEAQGGYMNLSSYTSGTVPITVGMVDIRSAGKTGWAPGDELGKVRWYANDTSGNWPGEVASIRGVCQDGNGSTSTVGSAALEFYTTPYNSITQSMALRLDTDQTADFQNDIKMGGTTVISSGRAITASSQLITDGGSATPTLDLNRSRDGGRIRFRYAGSTNTFGEIGMTHNGQTGDGQIWIGMNLNSFSASHSSPAQGNSGHASWYQEFSSHDDRIRFMRIPAGGSAAEVARFTGSGDFFVGNTVVNPASGFSNQRGLGYDAGIGQLELATTANSAALELGRNNANDGEMLTLRKQSTVVGSIGTRNGDLTIGTGDTGLQFADGSDAIAPLNMSTNALRDAAVDLGASTARFKDFYLSGNAQVGSVSVGTVTVVDASRNLTNISTITATGGGHTFSGGTTTFNVGRGSVYLENNTNSNASGAGITLRTSSNPGSDDGSIFDVRSSGQAIRFYVGQNLTSSGYNPFYVGCGTTTGQGTASNYSIELAANGNIIAEGNITAYGSASDIRLKENIEPITDALSKVKRLDGVTFTYKKDGSRSTGVIAQQVQEVLPEVIYESAEVGKSEDGEKFLAVRYGQMMGLAIEAIKELSAEVDSLKAKLKELEDGNH